MHRIQILRSNKNSWAIKNIFESLNIPLCIRPDGIIIILICWKYAWLKTTRIGPLIVRCYFYKFVPNQCYVSKKSTSV